MVISSNRSAILRTGDFWPEFHECGSYSNVVVISGATTRGAIGLVLGFA